MRVRQLVLVAFAMLALGVLAEDDDGIPVGAVAPAVKGAAWVTEDGKIPELKGKVYLIDFWFEH